MAEATAGRPVGFVGLGNMGLPMAHNLVKAGFALCIFNRTAARAESLLLQGATWAPSPAAVAKRTGIVISMVADDDALQAISLEEQGILAGLSQDGVHIDMSTVSPDTTRRLARAYSERGAQFVAAPVSGRPEHAAAAQLIIYTAGPGEVVERCRPLLNVLGRSVITVGNEPHLANVLKLLTNFLVFSVNEALSEALTLAEKAGLKSEPIREMIDVFFPAPAFQVFAKRIADSDFHSPGQNVLLALKDLGYIRRLADQLVAPLPLADLAYRHLQAALARGRGELDAVALATVVRELAGLPPNIGMQPPPASGRG